MRRVCKHNGTILITALMCSAFALISALLVLAAANKCFCVLNWKYLLLKKENVAVQAEAITKSWFCSSVKDGVLLDPAEFVPGAEPKDNPYIPLPDDLLTELTSKNEGINVEAKVIDQNYGDSFALEAERLNIPKGLPSALTMQKENESADICYVKRYCIIATASLSTQDTAPIVLTENLIVIKEPSGLAHAIDLYTEKHH